MNVQLSKKALDAAGALLLLLAMLLLAACGGDSGASPRQTAAPVNACALLPAADVEALYGMPVAEPTKMESGEVPTAASTLGYVSMCSYHTSGDAFLQASLLARQSFDAANAAQAMEQGRKELATGGSQLTAVEGFGEGATWNEQFGQLSFVKDNYWLLISADATTAASAQQNAATLAKQILGRL